MYVGILLHSSIYYWISSNTRFLFRLQSRQYPDGIRIHIHPTWIHLKSGTAAKIVILYVCWETIENKYFQIMCAYILVPFLFTFPLLEIKQWKRLFSQKRKMRWKEYGGQVSKLLPSFLAFEDKIPGVWPFQYYSYKNASSYKAVIAKPK